MSTTDHTRDPMSNDLDELLDAALDAAEASVADRFDAQRFDHRYGVERCEYGCAITLAEGTARELAQGMLTASLPVLLSDRRAAEARATAAEVASRGYRERAEKAEAKAARFAGLLGHQSRTLTDTIAAEVLRQKADAWDEGHHAGHEEARAVHPTYPDPTPNPYRQTEGA